MMIAPLRFLHVFSTFGTGGPQVRFAQIANDLARHGASPIEHVICAMDGRHDALSKLDPDVRYRIVEAPRSGRSVVRTINAFRQAFRHHAPDLLLTYNWGAIECSMANILHRLPEIHFEDGFGPDEAAGQLRRRILTRRLVLRRQALTVMPSQVLLDHARTLWRLPSSRLTYIPNGIDCSRFDVGRRADADGGDGNTRVVIGTVAGLRKEKNLARLLQAFAKLPEPHEASLVIVGSGPEEETLKAMALSLGVADRVQFKGFCARPETTLAGFDLFALSSDTEQMPISLVEAMASGLPVAAVDVGDVAEMVAEENRPLIVPKDADRLSTALAALITDPKRRRLLGDANRRRARELFDQELMFERYADLFQQAMGRTLNGSPGLRTADAD